LVKSTMQSQPVTSNIEVSIIDHSELSAFEHLNHFNLFLYSRNTTGVPIFLLYQGNGSSKFLHCSGSVTKHDPNIFFSVIREFITQNRGLLQAENLQHLLADSTSPFVVDSILLEENLRGPVRPQRGLTHAMDDVCRILAECPHIFQDKSGTVSYFVEIPILSPEAINEVAEAKELGFKMKYFTFDEILGVENEEICSKLRGCFRNNKLLSYTKKFIVEGEQIEIRERYAVMSCEPRYDNFMMHALHYSVYKKHGEQWTLYKAFKGEFPTDEELKTFKGMLIPGSSCSAYADHPWYKELFERISKIVNEHQQINLLLVCFGAQVTAQALGGKVEKMNRPFIRGQDELVIKSEFYEHEYIRMAGIDTKKPLFIAQSHGDHIVELPPRAVHHGSSVKTNVEIYTIGSHVLAFQGHPEYNEAWTAGSHYRAGKLEIEDYDTYAEEYMKNTFASPVSREDLLKLCFTFLKKDARGVAK